MCKPSTSLDVDPNTGKTYRTEINAAITAQGFFPLPLEVENGQGATSGIYGTTGSGIPSPAWSDGLSASAYNAANEAVAPWSYPAGDQDTDVSGSQRDVRRRLRQRSDGERDSDPRCTGRLLPDDVDGWQLHELRTPHLRFAAHCGSASAGPQWRVRPQFDRTRSDAESKLSARPGSAAWPRQSARRRWPLPPPRRPARRARTT